LLLYKNKRYGFEIKLNQAPSMTRSMQSALEDLRLDELFVIYPGTKTYPIAPQVTAVPVWQLILDSI
jgi:hypothetical protein